LSGVQTEVNKNMGSFFPNTRDYHYNKFITTIAINEKGPVERLGLFHLLGALMPCLSNIPPDAIKQKAHSFEWAF